MTFTKTTLLWILPTTLFLKLNILIMYQKHPRYNSCYNESVIGSKLVHNGPRYSGKSISDQAVQYAWWYCHNRPGSLVLLLGKHFIFYFYFLSHVTWKRYIVRYIGDNTSRNILQSTRSFYDFRFQSYSSWFLICLTLTFQGHLIFLVNSPLVPCMTAVNF